VFARKLIRLFGGVTTEDIENEARAISKLCGPGTVGNIVEVFNHGWLPRDRSCYFIDMELCSETLEQWILKRAQEGPLFGGERVLAVVRDIAAGLSYLHALQAVHRDLKPRNGTYIAFL
jgi:serine/threonine protein kinase